jgi:hypothetical protein
MADHYSNLSLAVSMNAEQGAWTTKLHDYVQRKLSDMDDGVETPPPDADIADAANRLTAEFDSSGGVTLQYFDDPKDLFNEPPYLWVEHDESADIHYVASLMEEFLRHFGLDNPICFQWSNDCSKPRLDAYGGGAVVVRRSGISAFHTSDWIKDQLRDDACSPISRPGLL